jgi:hypothetical protein
MRRQAIRAGQPVYGRTVLTWINAPVVATALQVSMWQPISTAPFGRDLELAVIDNDVPHALAFPCRRASNGWINAQSMKPVDVRPTHWRSWDELH